MKSVEHQAVAYILAPIARVWGSCTQPPALSAWFSAPCLAFGPKLGSPVVFGTPDREVIRGELRSSARFESLSFSFSFQGFGFEESSTVHFEFEVQGPVVLMRVRHDCGDAPRTAEMIGPLGWPKLLARLKTFLETGTAMPWPEE